jgi:hypothetical protein
MVVLDINPWIWTVAVVHPLGLRDSAAIYYIDGSSSIHRRQKEANHGNAVLPLSSEISE